MTNSERNGEKVSMPFPLLSWQLVLLNHTYCNITKNTKTTNSRSFQQLYTEIFLEKNRITSYDLTSYVTKNWHIFSAVSTNSCMMGPPMSNSRQRHNCWFGKAWSARFFLISKFLTSFLQLRNKRNLLVSLLLSLSCS